MKNPVTTITGVVMILLAGLTLFGVITEDQSAGIETYVVAVVEAVVGLIAIFKAGDRGGGV